MIEGTLGALAASPVEQRGQLFHQAARGIAGSRDREGGVVGRKGVAGA